MHTEDSLPDHLQVLPAPTAAHARGLTTTSTTTTAATNTTAGPGSTPPSGTARLFF